MPLTTNINLYDDVRKVIETARRADGGIFKTASRGEAIRWRQRAYMYRRLLREQLEDSAGNIPGYVPTTPYDTMKLRVIEAEVHISFGEEIPGELFTREGDPLTLVDDETPTIDPNDPLLLEAKKLAGDVDK